jgi:tRNA-specific 2-thiouridylase
VDSAVTLAVLKELGCEVACVTFKNFCYGDDERFTDRSCCSLDAIEAARRLAARWDAPHWVADVEAPFRGAVIEPFVAEYRAGRTPNPCLLCNGDVRFPELVRLADRQGCELAATGHYARVAVDDAGARLMRGVDPDKDQSYFLHRIDRALWPRLVFPLGWSTKPEVRRAARALDLPVADKPDSQEICFVPDDDRSFLFADGAGTRPGPVVDTQGRELGTHRGLVHYTVGQRRGLGIAAADPLYVVTLDHGHNRLVVGTKDDLAVDRLEADRFVAAVGGLPADGPTLPYGPVTARIRHRHVGAAVRRWRIVGDTLSVTLAGSVHGAAPGQGLVLYAGDTVLGGGRIVAAGKGEATP